MAEEANEQITLFEQGICPYCALNMGEDKRSDELIRRCQSCHRTLDLEELNLAWSVWEIDCDRCSHYWVALCPIQNKSFECSVCGFVNLRNQPQSD